MDFSGFLDLEACIKALNTAVTAADFNDLDQQDIKSLQDLRDILMETKKECDAMDNAQ